VFLNANIETTPLALRANVEHNHTVHACVVIMSIETERVPHVPIDQRVSIDDLGYRDDGITHITARYGFMDKIDVPATLRRVADDVEGPFDLDGASYFLSRISIVRTDAPGMARWRKRLFIVIARNAANPVTLFGLPDDRTVVLSAHIEV
jgi:KUP system potassium uptake protein